MSVLSFPRIYFQGYMAWDPCTFNNNDWQEFPTYDGVNAALNWPFLATQGITPQNFYSTFRPWAIALQPDCVDNPGGERLPAEWNMFGSHAVSFVQHPAGGFETKITGGTLGYNQPVTSDPLIGLPVTITGDPSEGSKVPGPGRLVDTNPASFWSSQIYFAGMAFGKGDCMIRGPRNFRMHSRWLDLNRIYTTGQALTQPAASVGCCFQTCIPYDEVKWPDPSVNSQLATKLQQMAQESPAIGIMVRFTAYVNVYFKNGVLNDFKPTPRNYKELNAALTAAWNEFNSTGKTDLFFSNPCYSHIVGTLGLWDSGEVGTAPVGRYLSAQNLVSGNGATLVTGATQAASSPVRAAHAVAAAVSTTTGPQQVALGPVVANVDYGAQLISLDLNSTIPENGTPGEWPSDLSKADFGSLDLGVVAGGTFTSIVQIPYTQYAQAAYEASAGIIDIPFPNSGTAALLQSGPLAIQVQQPGNPPTVTALQEQEFSAQTDSRGIYLDEGESTDFVVGVYDYGAPTSGTSVLIAQYDQSLSLVPTQATPLVLFTNGVQSTITSGGVATDVTVLTSDETGIVTPSMISHSPGFAVLAFFPFTGTSLPSPPPSLFGPIAPITYAFYTTIRVLPFDDGLPQEFVDQWNAGQDQTAAWQFVYNKILYVYDMLFNVMLEFVNLGSQSTVEQSISYIWPVITAEAAKESTMAMPITRDMSSGKRKTLQLWIYLVAKNYTVPNFNVHSIPPGWAPPS